MKELTTKELMDMVGGTPEKSGASLSDEISSFLKEHSIFEGVHFTSNYLLYDVYIHEFKPTTKKLTKTSFTRELNKVLKYTRKTTVRGFLINKPFSEDRRILAETRDKDRNEQSKKV